MPQDYEMGFIHPQLYGTLTDYLLIVFFSIFVSSCSGSFWEVDGLNILYSCSLFVAKNYSHEGVECMNPLQKLLNGPSYKPWPCNCQPWYTPKGLHLTGGPLYLLWTQGKMSKWRGRNSGTIRKRNQNSVRSWNIFTKLNKMKPHVTAFTI